MTDRQKVLPRTGSSDPFKYGPYRLVVTRRVTEEEQVSVECYEPTREAAEETFAAFMERFRQHMVAHNERVVMVHQDRLIKLERMIEHRAEELRELDVQLAEKQRGNGVEVSCDPPAAP